MVGLSSVRSELILIPRFSILTIVDAVMILAAWGTNVIELSKAVCAEMDCIETKIIKGMVVFFTVSDL